MTNDEKYIIFSISEIYVRVYRKIISEGILSAEDLMSYADPEESLYLFYGLEYTLHALIDGINPQICYEMHQAYLHHIDQWNHNVISDMKTLRDYLEYLSYDFYINQSTRFDDAWEFDEDYRSKFNKFKMDKTLFEIEQFSVHSIKRFYGNMIADEYFNWIRARKYFNNILAEED